MADITKCDGKGCDLKEKCYRFTANDGFVQSYFVNPPIVDNVCDYFLVWQVDILDSTEKIHNYIKFLKKYPTLLNANNEDI